MNNGEPFSRAESYRIRISMPMIKTILRPLASRSLPNSGRKSKAASVNANDTTPASAAVPPIDNAKSDNDVKSIKCPR
ncbi:MAG TPA: hypothetical protein DCM45_00790 [Clostridiales bacterium]|nr:hypothetical protein [Clostridiales bacterium]